MLHAMNPPDMRAAEFLQNILLLAITLQIFIFGGFFINFVASAWAGIHAAKRKETAWTLVIIFFPFVGWIAYWASDKDTPPNAEYIKPGIPGPAGQPNRTEQDVANEVSAALTAEIKKRRAERGQ